MNAKSGSTRWFEVVYIAAVLVILVIGVRWMGRGRVGVVDISRVAEALGIRETVEAETALMRRRTHDRIQALQREWEAETRSLREEYEAAEDDDARARLRTDLEGRQARFEAEMSRLRGEVRQQQRDLAAEVRRGIDPALREVARSSRLDVVIEAGPALLYRRESVDLTEAVIRRGRELLETGGGVTDTD